MATTEMNCLAGGGGGNEFFDVFSSFPSDGYFDVGFAPKRVMLSGIYNGAAGCWIWDESDATHYKFYYSSNIYTVSVGDSGSSGFMSIPSGNGFTLNATYKNNWTSGKDIQVWAV